jgi:replicative DNA helicase
MDVSSVVLYKLLSEGDLEAWSKLKLVYLDPAFSGLYSAISRHYEKYGELPTFDTIELVSRETATTKTLEILRLAEVPDVSIDVAIDALVDQYTQNETIKLLDKFLDKLPSYDTTEVKENLSSIVLTLDEKTYSAEGVYNMSNILLFKQPEELANLRFHLGLNNTFDAVLGGVAREEYILIGGQRGSGKSITAANICVNQYEAGNVCPYFTIEMNGHETLERIMAIAAKVSHNNIKKGTLSPDEILALVQTRANMFQDAQQLVTDFLNHRNRYRFEEELVRQCKLKEDNQIIIVDDRHLSLVSLDLHLGKIKSKFGDKFTVAVVDYINQIVIEGQDKYDWKVQIAISSKLKELARKYEIVLVSPYQLDKDGETRFSKGILDSADIALVMSAGESSMTFNTTKIRSDGEMKFTSGINWDTLRISPTPLEDPEEPKKIKRAGKESTKQEPEVQDDELPWN